MSYKIIAHLNIANEHCTRIAYILAYTQNLPTPTPNTNDTIENPLKCGILKSKGGVSMTIRDKRIIAVKTADAINAIEGVPVSLFAKQLSKQWADGELTGEQMKAALLAHHRKISDTKGIICN